MKTNKIMDEIRSTISPEMKMQMEMSVARACIDTLSLSSCAFRPGCFDATRMS